MIIKTLIRACATGEPVFAVCPTFCREQHTAKAEFAVCLAQAHGKCEAHGILGLCRESHTANTRYTANSNICEQHTAKTRYTTKANARSKPSTFAVCGR